ncbi:hypothetical protein SSBR45G_33120 [Bradyrhizobium sp. SSBR45G]|uniref:hypothetical protein n=1 Tax=unclassified Bradyrhizobium TaxID=2631580 RepID=UPI0023429EA6|nr:MULTISPECIES: hypothetical protein [unclassified Bradyrhizobium]GLH78403.1 hypothetical protein SSBR45G_33120 [Bradyrhizobium sp. SSBR45G]GLH86186.1 hypothetical protein SSBR45R_36460 [Bradyrhizobium sp. SSBR45R]
MPELAIERLVVGLAGAVATDDDVRMLTSRLGSRLTPDWLLSLVRTYALAGQCFDLPSDADVSGLGVALIWLTPRQIASEATESEPGMSVAPLGFIPIGACAYGSGDPYFLDLRPGAADPPLVRVPHDFAVEQQYPLGRIEVVTGTLSGFFAKASLSV